MRIARLLILAALIAGGLVATSTPASAACAGTLTTDARMYYPGVGPAAFGGLTAHGVGCFSGTFSNVVGNFCGLATGEISAGGRTGTFVWLGGTLTIGGRAAGTFAITPDAITGQSCMDGANRFLIVGTITWI